MRTRTTIAISLALVLLVGTAAAAPDAGPPDELPGSSGPPDELPSPVPDFVSDLLGSIGDFVASVLDGAGDTSHRPQVPARG